MAVYAPPQYSNFLQDYVVSGGVWTADSAGVNLNASMTAAVVCIGGVFINVGAVTARAFTASVDTYVDVTSAGVLVYTTAVTNAASPALTAGSLRLAIVVAGVTITTAVSVNQGQQDRVTPIASSIPYAVTDSLGNLICPRDPNRKILGYRQIIADQTNATTTTAQATGLSVPVIVPTGRKVCVSAFASALVNGTAGDGSTLTIWDGVVVSGTQLTLNSIFPSATISMSIPANAFAITTPATASKTYNVGFASVTGGTTTLKAGATAPAYVLVELV